VLKSTQSPILSRTCNELTDYEVKNLMCPNGTVVCLSADDDDKDDEERINFSVALSPKTTRTSNNKLKQ